MCGWFKAPPPPLRHSLGGRLTFMDIDLAALPTPVVRQIALYTNSSLLIAFVQVNREFYVLLRYPQRNTLHIVDRLRAGLSGPWEQ